MKRTKKNTNIMLLLATLLLLVTQGLFYACSSDDKGTPVSPTNADSEIRFKPTAWNYMEGTRATTYDDAAALQGEAHFTCVAYEKNSLTVYIPTTTVDWDSAENRWEFNGGSSHYYWPLPATNGGPWPSLDFFGYMPKAGSLPSYITAAPTYSAAHDVTFTCTSLPMTDAGQGSDLKEFVYAMALDQNKAGTNTATQPTQGQVALAFQHPFTRIKLQLSSAQEDIHINSITLKSIQNNGSYSHNSGWTPSGDATNFVATLNKDYEASDAIGTYIMVPQTWAGEIEINADWKVWDVVENHIVGTTVPTVWDAGHSYTYTFTITETDLKVDTSKYTEQW